MMLDVTFWTVWFIEPRLISEDTSEAFMHYENAFPLGHLLVLITVLLAYLALRTPRWAATALITLPAAAGAKGYITGVDVLYNLQHDLYFSSPPYYIILRLTLNVLTLAFTLIALRWTWAQRHQLIDAVPLSKDSSSDPA
ncbi:hypothetical protein A5692_21830 [Mycobacterium sp. E342]|nr:hypothetical protein A5692_21830 [Mycobacterium sp. E342]